MHFLSHKKININRIKNYQNESEKQFNLKTSNPTNQSPLCFFTRKFMILNT